MFYKRYHPGGYCPGGYWNGGILSGGILSWGDIIRGDIVRGILSGGYCPGDIVLIPIKGLKIRGARSPGLPQISPRSPKMYWFL